MAIVPGRRLGPYEILSAIGAGGMGKVDRARSISGGAHAAVDRADAFPAGTVVTHW